LLPGMVAFLIVGVFGVGMFSRTIVGATDLSRKRFWEFLEQERFLRLVLALRTFSRAGVTCE